MPDIATIGYADSPPSAFLCCLRDAGIRTVIDVRAVANSRKAGYAKRALAAALEEAGIRYWHVPQLGTPPAGREAARRGDNATLRRVFGAHLQTPEAQAALIELAGVAEHSPACLLCLEANPRQCHRDQIAQALHERFGFAVRHLHPGGGWAPLPKRSSRGQLARG